MNESELFLDRGVIEDIIENRARVSVNVELGLLVDQGLLEMGINQDGEAIFWPTPKGAEELGMELV